MKTATRLAFQFLSTLHAGLDFELKMRQNQKLTLMTHQRQYLEMHALPVAGPS
jgi:hypothetical protein